MNSAKQAFWNIKQGLPLTRKQVKALEQRFGSELAAKVMAATQHELYKYWQYGTLEAPKNITITLRARSLSDYAKGC